MTLAALTIAQANESDRSGLIEAVASAEYLKRYGDTLGTPNLYIDRAFASGVCLAARIDGKAVGLVWFTADGTLGRGGYIRLIVVEGACKGMGIGCALMAEAERQIFEKSANAFLLTSHFNVEAQAFYEKLGWTKCGELPAFVHPDITEFIYWKKRP